MRGAKKKPHPTPPHKTRRGVDVFLINEGGAMKVDCKVKNSQIQSLQTPLLLEKFRRQKRRRGGVVDASQNHARGGKRGEGYFLQRREKRDWRLCHPSLGEISNSQKPGQKRNPPFGSSQPYEENKPRQLTEGNAGVREVARGIAAESYLGRADVKKTGGV